MNNIKKINETLYLDTKEVAALTIIPSKEKSKIIIHLKSGEKITEEGDLEAIKDIKQKILGTYND